MERADFIRREQDALDRFVDVEPHWNGVLRRWTYPPVLSVSVEYACETCGASFGSAGATYDHVQTHEPIATPSGCGTS